MAVRKALIVDDSKVARFTLAKRLQGHGLTVLSAESADDAINQLRTEKPDVIFMDFMMPGVNGLQAAEHLAADASTANIPVIMCTGNDASELNMDNASGNVCGILTKGSDDQELLAMLDSLPAAPAAPAPAPIDLDALVEQATQRALEAANRHAEEMVGRQLAALRSDWQRELEERLQSERTDTKDDGADRQADWLAEAVSRIDASSTRLREEFDQRLGAIASERTDSASADPRMDEAMKHLQELQSEVERLAAEIVEDENEDSRDLLNEITRHSAEHAIGLVNELRGEMDEKLSGLSAPGEAPYQAMEALKSELLTELDSRLSELRNSVGESGKPDEIRLREMVETMSSGIEERAIAAAVASMPTPNPLRQRTIGNRRWSSCAAICFRKWTGDLPPLPPQITAAESTPPT